MYVLWHIHRPDRSKKTIKATVFCLDIPQLDLSDGTTVEEKPVGMEKA